MDKIGIFTAKGVENADGVPISFFQCNDYELLEKLYKHASSIVGPGLQPYEPEDGLEAKHVGDVIIQPVDGGIYTVKVDGVGKPETGRKPDGDTGTWVVQSVIFSKDNFTEATAKKWIADHDDFVNAGVDETETSYRFPQYDDKWFSEFKTISITEGVSAAYGKIASEEMDEEASKALLDESIAKYQAVHNINKAIMRDGLNFLTESCKECKLTKADGEEYEERFIMSMVLEPNDGKDGALKPDTQDDVYDKAFVRSAAHIWMENGGMVDLQHSWVALGKNRVCPVESFIAPIDFKLGSDTILEGTWMLGLRIYDDDLWKACKNNDLGAYSIGGTATRTPETQPAQ